MSETTYYRRNREVILNRAKDYYENSKELLREREQKINIENYLKRKTYKKRVRKKKRYHNMSEEDKKKLKEYHKKYREAKKHASEMQTCQ